VRLGVGVNSALQCGLGLGLTVRYSAVGVGVNSALQCGLGLWLTVRHSAVGVGVNSACVVIERGGRCLCSRAGYSRVVLLVAHAHLVDGVVVNSVLQWGWGEQCATERRGWG